jgi:hypothetical protein
MNSFYYGTAEKEIQGQKAAGWVPRVIEPG